MDNTTADILRIALEMFEDGVKWIQGQGADDHGGACAVGALTRADLLNLDDRVDMARFRAAYAELRNVLREQWGMTDIVAWNDNPARTFDEVRALFEKAIARAEELGT